MRKWYINRVLKSPKVSTDYVLYLETEVEMTLLFGPG